MFSAYRADAAAAIKAPRNRLPAARKRAKGASGRPVVRSHSCRAAILGLFDLECSGRRLAQFCDARRQEGRAAQSASWHGNSDSCQSLQSLHGAHSYMRLKRRLLSGELTCGSESYSANGHLPFNALYIEPHTRAGPESRSPITRLRFLISLRPCSRGMASEERLRLLQMPSLVKGASCKRPRRKQSRPSQTCACVLVIYDNLVPQQMGMRPITRDITPPSSCRRCPTTSTFGPMVRTDGIC